MQKIETDFKKYNVGNNSTMDTFKYFKIFNNEAHFDEFQKDILDKPIFTTWSKKDFDLQHLKKGNKWLFKSYDMRKIKYIVSLNYQYVIENDKYNYLNPFFAFKNTEFVKDIGVFLEGSYSSHIFKNGKDAYLEFMVGPVMIIFNY